jgi:hypothetical protein
MLDVILIPQHFDEKLIGWFGFAQIFCVAFGTCVMGMNAIYFISEDESLFYFCLISFIG